MINIVDFIKNSALSSFYIYLIDRTICKKHIECRWFMLHSLVNIIICYLTYTDFVTCLLFPEFSSDPIPLQFAGFLALVLHAYHCIMFQIRMEDWIHHVSSVFLVTPIFILYPSRSTSMFLFSATGLPGAIDYTNLVLYKKNYTTKYTQKQITSIVNSYVRMPVCFISSYFLFKDSMVVYNYNVLLFILSFVLYVNSGFYGKQAIESFEKYKYSLI